jgi:hypothetical protein
LDHAKSDRLLEQTLAMVREIARAESLHFRFAVLRADIDKAVLKAALASGGVVSIDDMPALDAREVDASSNIVGQMGMSAFKRALAAGVDVIIAGRACDTAIFATLPTMAGFPIGPAEHMAKIIECASLCCVPGGRDSMLATLDHDGFVLESMAPQRRATPVSVRASARRALQGHRRDALGRPAARAGGGAPPGRARMRHEARLADRCRAHRANRGARSRRAGRNPAQPARHHDGARPWCVRERYRRRHRRGDRRRPTGDPTVSRRHSQ